MIAAQIVHVMHLERRRPQAAIKHLLWTTSLLLSLMKVLRLKSLRHKTMHRAVRDLVLLSPVQRHPVLAIR